MSEAHEYGVSDNAVRQGRACGLYGDTAARVRGIAAASVPAKHPAGNRLYGPFILHVRRGTVISITMLGPRVVDDRPVSACQLCHGMMVRRVRAVIEGREGYAARPCPRAFDPSKPLCDTTTDRKD